MSDKNEPVIQGAEILAAGVNSCPFRNSPAPAKPEIYHLYYLSFILLHEFLQVVNIDN
jgi:hypothetical protein